MLASPPFARAVHTVLQVHAAAMPSLRRQSLREVATALAALGVCLRFVASAAARLVLRDSGTDVSRNGAPIEVQHLWLCFSTSRTSGKVLLAQERQPMVASHAKT